mmetsp:Transcript_43978/g.91843  ORF Transcript_43978/g.91843 Transcript_43978/m.91843 type:complete len:201 (-) Transcript_43978:248-850(-)|eukprot:6187264-Pleurochrysis_carterae.AAC.10
MEARTTRFLTCRQAGIASSAAPDARGPCEHASDSTKLVERVGGGYLTPADFNEQETALRTLRADLQAASRLRVVLQSTLDGVSLRLKAASSREELLARRLQQVEEELETRGAQHALERESFQKRHCDLEQMLHESQAALVRAQAQLAASEEDRKRLHERDEVRHMIMFRQNAAKQAEKTAQLHWLGVDWKCTPYAQNAFS